MIYVIPARKGSKGLPGKNKMLLPYTLSILSDEQKAKTIITTDDLDIMSEADKKNIATVFRPAELCDDTASMRKVLVHLRNSLSLHDEIFCLLYLTYPQRQSKDISAAIACFIESRKESLLCSQPVLTHPYMCINDRGQKIINHNYYRRQDYPKVREISHFIGIFKANCLEKLNENLHNNETFYMEIPRMCDIDTPQDWENFREIEDNSNRHGR